jgi:nitrile hydratase accessory protein
VAGIAMTSRRAPPRHPDMPPIPQDGDGPVFREPWEAQAFAVVLDLYDKGHFTWPEWVRCLSAEIAAAWERGEPDPGSGYYRHWLAALETLVAAKGLSSRDELAVRKRQWAEADHHRGFGEPIALGSVGRQGGGGPQGGRA